MYDALLKYTPWNQLMARKLLLILLLTVSATPSWADYVFNGCTIRVPTPPATSCPGAFLLNANLTNTDLTGAELSNANLTYATLTGANLHNANLHNAKLSRVESGGITGTPYALPAGWQLTNGYLVGPYTSLTSADLTGADLTGADLSNAFLVLAKLTGANLTGANLTNADLSYADLTGVIWNSTTCVDGSNSDYHLNGSCLTEMDNDGDGVPDEFDSTPLGQQMPLNGIYKGSSIKEAVEAE